LSQTFFLPPNSPDLNPVNLPSGVLFSRRSTIIKVSPQLTNEESDCQKHDRNYRTVQLFINKSVGKWRRRPECAVRQNGGHIEQLFN